MEKVIEIRKEMKVLKIDEIRVDEKIYPRDGTNWLTIYKYTEAMKTGAQFPPITVASNKKHYILVDGRHRLEAYKKIGQKHVQTDVLKGLSEKEIFIEAVKRNMIHGLPLSAAETTRVILKLQNLRMTPIQISEIVGITVDKIEPFVIKRVTQIPTGETVILKAPLRHLSYEGVSNRKISYDQEDFGGMSQYSLLREINTIIENKWLNLRNDKVAEEVVRLYKLLKQIVFKIKLGKHYEHPGRPVVKKPGRPKSKKS